MVKRALPIYLTRSVKRALENRRGITVSPDQSPIAPTPSPTPSPDLTPNISAPIRRAKRPPKKYVTPSDIRNYFTGDTLVDWLRLWENNSSTQKKPTSFIDFILDKGEKFESDIVRRLREKHHVVTVSTTPVITDENLENTRKQLESGVPIIHSAPLRNTENNTQGIADLLIRSDIINSLLETNALTKKEQSTSSDLSRRYHYVVVDVKFSTLRFLQDGVHLSNAKKFRSYKAQLHIYNEALGSIQGYTPPYAFLLGRRWEQCSGCYDGSDNPLSRLGRVAPYGKDVYVSEETIKAIAWVRELHSNGHKWQLNPPTRPELYPNMCNDSGRWNTRKQELADELGEISQLWYCGDRERTFALKNGVTSWRDEKCTSEILGLNDGKRARIIDKFLEVNRGIQLVSPEKISTKLYTWRDTTVQNFYVDFETFPSVFFDDFNDKGHELIFMIGVGWEENGEWYYKSYTCDEPTLEEELRICHEFYQHIHEVARKTRSAGQPKLWYWHAERNFWNRVSNRQFDRLHSGSFNAKEILRKWNTLNWCDLCQVFREEPIIIKNSFNFSLKSVGKAMLRNKMIETSMESECNSGQCAMVQSWQAYKDNNPDVLDDVEVYNEYDCKVMWDILRYMRENL